MPLTFEEVLEKARIRCVVANFYNVAKKLVAIVEMPGVNNTHVYYPSYPYPGIRTHATDYFPSGTPIVTYWIPDSVVVHTPDFDVEPCVSPGFGLPGKGEAFDIWYRRIKYVPFVLVVAGKRCIEARDAIVAAEEHHPLKYTIEPIVPSVVCKNSIARIGFKLKNKGFCGKLSFRINLSERFSGTKLKKTITVDPMKEKEWRGDLPVLEEFEAIAKIELKTPVEDYREVFSETYTLLVRIPELSISPIILDKPSYCPHEKFAARSRVVALNCPQHIRLTMRYGGKVIEREEEVLPVGEGLEIRGSEEVGWTPQTITLEVERYNYALNKWENIESIEAKPSLKVLPNLEVVSKDVPEYAIPGYSTAMSYIVRNTGECTGEFTCRSEVLGRRVFSDRFTLSPGEETTKVITFTCPGTDFKLSTVFRRVDPWNTLVLDLKESIMAVRNCRISLTEKKIQITAGDDVLTFAGVLAGKGFQQPYAPGIRDVKAIAGRLSPYERVEFTFKSLDYARIAFDKEVSYVLNTTLRKKDTKEVFYATIALPLLYPLIGRKIEELHSQLLV